jgi:hypothetical protein
VSALVIAGLAFAAPASNVAADEAPTDAAQADLLRAVHELERAQAALNAKQGQLPDARAAIAATQASFNVTQGLAAVNAARLAEVTERVRQRGVDAYRRFGGTAGSTFDVESATDLNSARTYANAASEVDTLSLSELRATEHKLDDRLQSNLHDLDEALSTRDALENDLRELTGHVQSASAVLQRSGAVTVMGASELTAVQLAAWYRSTGAVPSLAPGTSIDDVAALYLEEGDAEGVRGDYAFVQAIVETGYFKVAAGNNYSGIGVCDSCTGGYGFPTPRDGVRAQIQLLRNYADPDSRADNLAHPPSPSLYGQNAEKAARLYDTFFLKGKAPLWNMMGGGNWATDPVYAPKVLALHAKIAAWAVLQPNGAAS